MCGFHSKFFSDIFFSFHIFYHNMSSQSDLPSSPRRPSDCPTNLISWIIMSVYARSRECRSTLYDCAKTQTDQTWDVQICRSNSARGESTDLTPPATVCAHTDCRDQQTLTDRVEAFQGEELSGAVCSRLHERINSYNSTFVLVRLQICNSFYHPTSSRSVFSPVRSLQFVTAAAAACLASLRWLDVCLAQAVHYAFYDWQSTRNDDFVNLFVGFSSA